MTTRLRARLAANTSWHGVRMVAITGTAFATSIAIARTLETADVGRYNYATWVLATLTAVVTLGFPTAITKFVAEALGRGEPGESLALTAWVVRRVGGVALLATAGLAGYAVVAAPPDLSPLLILVALALGPAVVGLLLASAVLGRQCYPQMSRITLIVAPVQLGLIAAALAIRPDPTGPLLVVTAMTYVNLGLVIWLYRRSTPEAAGASTSGSWRADLVRYSGSLALLMLLDQVVWQRSEVFFLERFSRAEEIAFYSIAYALAQMALFVPNAATGALLPAIADLYGRRADTTIAFTYRTAVRALAIVAAPLCFGLAAIAGPALHLIYGQRYLEAAPALTLIATFNVFGALSLAGSAVVFGTRGLAGRPLVFAAIAAAVNLGLDVTLIPPLGATGAAFANGVAQMTGVVLSFTYLRRLYGVSVPLADLVRALVVGAGVAVVAGVVVRLIADPAAVVFAVVAGGLVYVPLLVVTGALRQSDLALVQSLARRVPGGGQVPWERLAGLLRA